ncbi:MAG: ubiquinone/menaquinone biosynthesis methyltransferase [Chloroflexota bacterium]|nr:ubiquinone/menaquinone biosynthesis methyltransferase [Chloroflexota bacterium]
MATGQGNPAPPEAVAAVFDRIAPIYDLMNTVMTAGIDRRWRAAAIAAAGVEEGMSILDVACGTGALTRALAARVGPGGAVTGVDRSEPMLAHARRARRRGDAATPSYLAADALALPFAAGRFDVVTMAFGLRNMPDYAAALAEMTRVVRPDGRVVILEIAEPRRGLGRLLFRSWFRRVIPVLGRIVGRAAAYRYLPASLATYPAPEAIAGLMRAVGLQHIRWRRLATGMATLHVAIAPPATEAAG